MLSSRGSENLKKNLRIRIIDRRSLIWRKITISGHQLRIELTENGLTKQRYIVSVQFEKKINQYIRVREACLYICCKTAKRFLITINKWPPSLRNRTLNFIASMSAFFLSKISQTHTKKFKFNSCFSVWVPTWVIAKRLYLWNKNLFYKTMSVLTNWLSGQGLKIFI